MSCPTARSQATSHYMGKGKTHRLEGTKRCHLGTRTLVSLSFNIRRGLRALTRLLTETFQGIY